MERDRLDFEFCDDDFDDEEDDGGDCGQMSDGTCMMEGTEYCDLECPYRN